jgi:hypothetical protein
MYTFFHGWRRKAGVVSLVMACVLMVGWGRSQIRYDVIGFQVGDRQQIIQITDGHVYWWGISTLSKAQFVWQSGAPQSALIDEGRSGFSDDEGWAWRFREWKASYLAGAIPLTLLSTYLILWKPRKRA